MGIGTLITVVATTAAADVTGVVVAGGIAAVGFFVFPAKRARAKAEMRRKIAGVRARLSAALRGQFEDEIARSLVRLRDSVAPYMRFVRAEGRKLSDMDTRLTCLGVDLARVRDGIDRPAA